MQNYNLYLIKNQNQPAHFIITIDDYLPIQVDRMDTDCCDLLTIAWMSQGIFEIKINKESLSLNRLALISSCLAVENQEQLANQGLIKISQSLKFGLSNLEQQCRRIEIAYPPTIEFGINYVKIIISKNAPIYLFCENSQVGALCDSDLFVTGFIIQNLSHHEIKKIKQYYMEGKKIMKNTMEQSWKFTCIKNELIVSVLSLKKINIASLLLFGLQQDLVDVQFCIDCIIKGLEEKILSDTDPFFIEIAGILDTETTNLMPLLEKISSGDLKGQEQYHNKVWFYCFSAADLLKNNLL